MGRSIVFLIIVAAINLSFVEYDDYSLFPSKLEKKINKTIRKSFDLKKFELLRDSKMESPENLDIFSVKSDEEVMGYAVVSLTMGCKLGGCTIASDLQNKDGHEDFYMLTLYNLDLTVKKMKILDYSSNYGYEITSKNWLKQFIGKVGTDVKVNKNIDGISGATISVNSVLRELKNQHKHLTK